MRLEQDTNFTALSWVKPELDESLKQARLALQDFVEEGGDRSQLQACAAHLHQVQGALRMVEIYGAAMVAEEMEQLATALLGDAVADRDEAYAALMRGIMQLPDYLERLQSGHRDIPMVLLPLLNDLRSARGEKVVPESVLFSADVQRPLPSSAGAPPTPLAGDALRAAIAPIRDGFRGASMAWLREQEKPGDVAALADAATRMFAIVSVEPARKLFWIAENLLGAVAGNMFVAGKPLRQAIARLEGELDRLASQGEAAFAAAPPTDLTRQLLYYASSAPTEDPRILAVRDVFALQSEAHDETELAHARGSLAGHNRELIGTVAAGIKEDLLRVKDALDLHLRADGAAAADLAPQADVLTAVADTLGMLGLGVPRKRVQEQRDALRQLAGGQRAADETALLDIAGSLLQVEAMLDDQVARLGQVESERPETTGVVVPLRESQDALDALIKESVANFVQARQCFVAFIEAGWDHAQLQDVPRLLDEVSGAMHLLEQPRAARQLRALSVFTQFELVKLCRVPDAAQMDRLADALASLEYYLEALRDHRPQRDRILELAEHGLVALGYWPIPAAAEQALAEAAKPVAPAEPVKAPEPTKAPATAVAAAPVVSEPVVPEAVMPEAVVVPEPEATPSVAAEPAVQAPALETAPVASEAAAIAAPPMPAVPGKNYGFADSAEIDDDIREVFIEELDEEVTNLGELYEQWCASPNDLEVLRPLRRVFHTLKGSGRLVGALELGEFSWKLEGMLNRVLDGSRPASPPVIALVGTVRDILPQFRGALMGTGQVTADIEGLKECADRLGAGEEVFYEPKLAVAAAEAVVPEPVAEAEPVAAPLPAAEPVVEVEPVVEAEQVASIEPVVEAVTAEPALPVLDVVPEPALAEGAAYAKVDPVLLEILRAEVGAHLQTIHEWVASSSASAQPVTDPLLRAVHTISGAFAMTEVPLITEALSPTEGYIRRLLVHHLRPTDEGVELVRDVERAIAEVLAALHHPEPVVQSQEALAERAIALRDSLPEPTAPTLPVSTDEAEEAAEAAAQAEADRVAAEQAEAERVAAEQAEAERVAAEQAEAERAAAEHAEAERVAAEQAEAERVAAEQAEADRVAAAQAEAERVAAAQAEAERVAAEQAEAERVAAEQAEAERVAAEQAEAERVAAEQAEAERVAAEQAEAERVAAEQAEAERVAAEQAEAERVAAEQAEAERVAAEQAEAERVAAEQAEAERAAAEHAEAERVAAEQAEAERVAAEQAEADRVAAAQAEAERVAAAQAEAERVAAEQAEAERVAAEQAEAERVAAEQAEAERVAAEQAEAERVAAEQAEADRVAAAQVEAERVAAEQAEQAERFAAEQAQAERLAAERRAAEQAELDWLAAAMAEELGHAGKPTEAPVDSRADEPMPNPVQVADAPSSQPQIEPASDDSGSADRIETVVDQPFAAAPDAAHADAAEPAASEPDEAERTHAERAAFEQAHADEQARSEQLEYERLEAEYAEQARLAEQQRRAAEQAEAERLEYERLEAEYAAQTQAGGAEQAAAEQAEAERVAAEQAEAERVAAEQAEAERVAAEQAEAERVAAEQAEAERVAAEHAEAERVAAEQAEAERVAAEQAEAERVAAEQAEAERVAAEQAEAERVAAAHAEAERVAAEQAEAERVAAAHAEAERVAAEHAEAERVAAEQAEAERAATQAMGARLAQEAQSAADAATTESLADESHAPVGESVAVFRFPAGVDPDPDTALDMTDVDPDLLDIFVEETTDILDHSDGLLSRLREAPTERELVVGLQRDLHTLKGGARMCGMMSMGELAHAMESVLEGAADSRLELGAQGLGVLEQGFDRLHGMLSRITARQSVALPETMIDVFNGLARGVLPAAAPAETPAAEPTAAAGGVSEAARAAAVEPATAEPATPEPMPAAEVSGVKPVPADKPGLKPLSRPVEAAFGEDDDVSVRAPQEQVRIRADLLDRLVNYAGEVAIYRARLEQQLGTFRTHLDEMEQTTTRLRQQLRKLEIETEAQISARYQRAGEVEKEFDPLELDRFSTQQQLTRALSESASDMTSLHASLDDVTRQYETLLLQQSRVSSELQDGLMRTRMVPFDALVPRLRRVVRQAATETDKQIQLKVEGAQGEMDRNVLDRMTAPLEHMLRNSAVHGLESPDERRAAGKAEEGTVTVSMRREGSEVVMHVADDGRGLNRDAIRKKAIERGLLKADAVVSDNALYAFILESGFSTADTVSRLAGRGVGMDVVHNEIRQLGGTLQLDSTAGKGTTFTIRLPFTLAVTQAAIVKIGETSFAVPISSVQGVGRIARDELEKQLASGSPTFMYAGEPYAIHDLGRLLGQAPAKAPTSLQMPLLLSRSGDARAAICVDEVLGSREIVVKPVGPQVSSIPGIFGATIMGDGRVMVILDVVPLVRRVAAQALLPEEPVVEAAVETRRIPLVMVVDDSITMRKVTGRVLERNNLEVLAAKDGVDAIEKMAEVVPDVMLLDIEMPRMDGYELATHMRNDPRLREVPIIMITSRSGDKHRQRAFEIGVNRYLGKPYQEAELMRNVFELLTPVHNDG